MDLSQNPCDIQKNKVQIIIPAPCFLLLADEQIISIIFDIKFVTNIILHFQNTTVRMQH